MAEGDSHSGADSKAPPRPPRVGLALVVGGAGEVGEGVVRVLLQHGSRVVVPSRSARKLDELRARVGHPDQHRLVTVVADISTEPGAALVRRRLLELGEILDLVVASVGGWWQGVKLVDVALDTWDRIMRDGLTGHFMTARTFLPLLRSGGSYILLNGAAARVPVPAAGPISIVAAAQLMLKDVLATEVRGVAVSTLLIDSPVRTRSRPVGRPDWVTADEVGQLVLQICERPTEARGRTFTLGRHREAPAIDAPPAP